MSEELRPALSHKDALLRINELIEERDYWQLRYEAARDVARTSGHVCHTLDCKCGKEIDEEVERMIKENK